MKHIKLTIAAITLTVAASAQHNYAGAGIGYSNQSKNPVFGFTIGRQYLTERILKPITEAGLVARTDRRVKPSYAYAGGGINWQGLCLTLSGVYGGNQQKQDRHILPDGTVHYNWTGADQGNFVSWQVAMRYEIEAGPLVIYGQGAYCHGLVSGVVGIMGRF